MGVIETANNKVTLIGDLHFGVKNFNLDFLKQQLNALQEYCKILKEKNVNTIIQLGDVFDNRKNIDNNFLYRLKTRLYEIFEGFDVYCIVGNHDMYFRQTREVNSPSIHLKDFFKEIFVHPSLVTINEISFAMFPYFSEKEFIQLKDNGILNRILEPSEVILGHFEFKDFNFAYNTINNHSNYGIEDFKKDDKLLFSGHYHFSNNKHYIGTPYQIDFKEFGLVPKIIVLSKDKDKGSIEVEEIENTWSVRHYKLEIYSDKIMLEYDFTKGKQLFKNKEDIPEFCKIGNIYVKEENKALEKILEFFSVKSDSISVYRENLLQEIKSMTMNDEKVNGIMSSDVYIKEYIKDNKPSLLPLLEKIWK